MNEKKNLVRTVSRNSIYTVAYNAWYLGSRLVLTPLILTYVTIEEYGLWSYCFVVLSYLALTAFGFNNTYVKYTADYRSRNENEKLNTLLSTGIFTMLGISTVLFPLFWLLLPWLLAILGIDPGLKEIAGRLMLGTAAIFVLNFCLSGYQYILEGDQQIALVRKIHLAASVVEIALMLIFFQMGWGVFSLLWAYAVRLALVIVLCMVYANREFPFLRICLKCCSMDALKKFLGFGNQMNLLGLLSLLINSLDRIFITRMLHLQALGVYEIGRKLPNIGLMLPSSIAGTMMPAASHLKGSSQHETLRRMYLTATRYLMIVSSIPYAFLLFFASQIIEVWVGRGYPAAATVMQILALGTFVNLFTGIGTACVRGIGKPVYEIRYMAVSVGIILVLLPFVIPYGGVVGAAWAYCIGQSLGSIYFLKQVNRLFGIAWGTFLKQTLLPVALLFLAGLPAYGLCYFLWPFQDSSRWVGLGMLVIIGLIYVATGALCLLLFQRRIFSREEIQKAVCMPVPGPVKGYWRKLWWAA